MKCQVSVTNSSGSIAAGGGTAKLVVSALPECAWSAEPDAGWIAEVTPPSGQGSAEIDVRVAPNPQPAMRQGSVQVNSSSIRITQEAAPCQLQVAPSTRAVPSAGGTVTVAVTGINGCTWTAASGSNWISIGAGASGNGSGVVHLTAAANSGAARVGSVTVAEQRLTITQDAAEQSTPNCTYSVAPLTSSVGTAGGPGTITVTTTAGCVWTAASNESWITIDGTPGGTGPGVVGFTVTANGGAARSGTMSIAGKVVTVSQAAASVCTYGLNPTSQSAPASGATGLTAAVTAGTGCTWTATSAESWIAITGGASGSGNGTVAFTVLPNTGAARSGSMTIAGQTFSVTQTAAPPPPCSYALGSSAQTVGSAGGTATPVSVTTTAGCTWTSSSNAAWISVTSGSSGTGPGSVALAVLANTGPQRSSTVTIAGKTHTVTQATGCTYSINPTTQSVSENAGTGTVSVTAAAGCAWTAVSNVSWMTVTAGAAGSGNGTVRFAVTANTGKRREGTLTIAGRAFTVTQAKD